MKKRNLLNCKAETEGNCSFDCIDCYYESKEGLNHFRYLYNQIIN